jgi:2-dehydropantoate 2-reductase
VTGHGVAADLLPMVCAQNGVENERVALRRFARVYGMAVLLPAGHIEPGLITAHSDPVAGVLILGRYPSDREPGDREPGATDRTAERIAADLSASRLLAPIVPDIQRWKYAKLLRNLANAIEAVCGTPDQDPDFARLRELAVQEGRAVLAAAGIDIADDAELDRYLSRLALQDVPGAARGGGSSWQSVVRRTGTIESDYLNGEIVLLARMNGRSTPVNHRLQQLARQAAAAGRRPGSTTAGQILTDLGLERSGAVDEDHRPKSGDWLSTNSFPR